MCTSLQFCFLHLLNDLGQCGGGEGLHKSAAVYLHLLNDLGQCGGKGLHKSAAEYLHLLMFWDSACVGGGGRLHKSAHVNVPAFTCC